MSLKQGDELPNFQPVSKQTAVLSHPLQGLFYAAPITFYEQHAAVANVAVHIVVLEFKFRPAPLSDAENDDVVLIVAEGKKASPTKKTVWRAHDFTEFVVAQSRGQLTSPVSAKYFDVLYDRYILPLACMKDKLLATYTQLTTHCVAGPRTDPVIPLKKLRFGQRP